MIVPIGIMHADRLLPLEDARLVAHHTRLVKSRLPIEDENVTIEKVPVDFLVDGGGASAKTKSGRTVVTFLGCQ